MYNINFGLGAVRQNAGAQAVRRNKNIISLNGLDHDCFVKRSNFGIEMSKEQKMEKLYDETFKEVMTDMSFSNPVVSTLNLPKPFITFTENDKNADIAKYNHDDNELILSEKAYDDLFFVISRDENGGIVRHGIVPANDIDEGMKNVRGIEHKKLEVLRLTEDEKEFQLKAAIAHELRHYIQQHLIEAAQDNKDEDTTLKFTSSRRDNRQWSVSEHFVKANEMSGSSEDKGDNHLSNPTEIDANNYEYEYINRFANVNNVRPEIAEYFAQEAKERSDMGLEYMQNNGYQFV